MWIWTLNVERIISTAAHLTKYCDTVPELQTLLAERQSKLPDNLYRQSSQVDAQLITVGQDICDILKTLKSLATKIYQPQPAAILLNISTIFKLSSLTNYPGVFISKLNTKSNLVFHKLHP